MRRAEERRGEGEQKKGRPEHVFLRGHRWRTVRTSTSQNEPSQENLAESNSLGITLPMIDEGCLVFVKAKPTVKLHIMAL